MRSSGKEISVNILQLIALWIVGLGILNVWLLRARIATAYRAGDASNMTEEFKVYGLPPAFMYFIGTIKVFLAVALIAGTWYPQLIQPSAIAMAVLMASAILMHIRVKDTFKKTSPSIAVFLLTILIIAA